MNLPFTQAQFFDVFAMYNRSLWPGALALWIATVAICALLRRSNRSAGRAVSALLAIHWGWAAVAYHAAFFTRINPAAWTFAALFGVQAGLFLWFGVIQQRLRFAQGRSAAMRFGWILIAYALLYPAINAGLHQDLWRIPSFGVPCPTVILTLGVLLLAEPRRWILSVIPLSWAVVASSAPFVFGVWTDLALPIGAVALAASLIARRAETASA